MTPPPETLIAVQESAPTLMSAMLRLILATVVIAAAAWAWFYWQRKVKAPSRQLEVLDRAFLARGAAVALIRVLDRRVLVGVSSEGVRLIRDLDADEEMTPSPSFGEVLSNILPDRPGKEGPK